jgi:hypothetical protein
MHYVILLRNSRSELTDKKHKAMKTSILISSFVTLSLLVTFAKAPRRHGEAKMNLTSTENVSIKTIESVTMLPAVVITADLNTEADNTIPVIAVEDFSYLEFDVAKYIETDANNLDEVEVLPVAIETDFIYLKFNVSDYTSDSEFNSDETAELPVTENNAITIPELASFEYLRFDVNDYINSIETESAEIGELPIEEVKTEKPAAKSVACETPIEFSYLKFDVTKYYSSSNQGSDEMFELPEK